MNNRIIKICILLALSLTIVGSAVKIEWLIDLKNTIKSMPIVVVNPNGGYVALWSEIDRLGNPNETPFYYSPYNLTYMYYYRSIDRIGNLVVPKKELKFTRSGYSAGYGFSAKSCFWIAVDKMVIVAWTYKEMLSNPPSYGLERIIIDTYGNILSGPDSAEINFHDCALIKDSNGNIHAVELGYGPNGYVRTAQVYPEFDSPKEILPYSISLPYSLSGYDNAVTITIHDDFLVICRMRSLSGKPKDESPKGWAGLPNHLVCFLIDMEGNLTAEPYKIDLTKDAFRKISGIHLGGNYGYKPVKAASKDLDLTHLPNGEIILSTTGLDEHGELCAYQVKFTDDGKCIRPDVMEVTKARKFPEDRTLPVTKILPATIGLGEISGRNKVLVRREYVLFGFDEDGNFYEEREVWKEGEE